MPHRFADRVLETTTTTGTGALTLAGALAGHRPFSAIPSIAVSDTVWYALWAVDTNGNATGDYESGLGTYSATNTLTRTAVLASSNSGSAVSLSAGTKYVAVASLSNRTLQLDDLLTLALPAATGEPPAPTGGVDLYAREILPGHIALKVKRPSGIDTPLQDALAFNGLAMYRGSNNAIVAVGASALTMTGTATAVTPASGSAKAAVRRVQYASGATAGNLTSYVAPNAGSIPVFRGGQNGEGGFRVVQRMALNALQSGNRGFWGLAASTTAFTNVDPLTTAAPARIGLAINANTGNMRLVQSSGSTVSATDLGSNFPVDTTSLYELVLFARPHNGTSAGDIGYRVRRYTTSSADPAFETTGTLTTNVPAATTLLHPWGGMTNNATAAAVSYHFVSLAIESDW